MAKIKVGINGFGRIGRLVFRAAMTRNDIEIVGINDLIDVDYMVYMLKYDTMHGRFNGTAEAKDGKLVVNGQAIRVTAEKDPANLKWDEVGAEYVVESTGLFLTKEKAEAHIKAGPKTIPRCSLWVSTTRNMPAKRSFQTLLVQPTVWLR